MSMNILINTEISTEEILKKILRKFSGNTKRGNGVQEEVEMEYCRRVGVPLKTDTSFVLPSCSQGGGRDGDGRGVLCPIAIFEVPAPYPLSDTFRF